MSTQAEEASRALESEAEFWDGTWCFSSFLLGWLEGLKNRNGCGIGILGLLGLLAGRKEAMQCVWLGRHQEQAG